MITRQAIRHFLFAFLFIGLSACTVSPQKIVPTQTPIPDPPPAISITASATIAPSPTPLTCLSAAGRVQQEVLADTKPPQQFLIYLPPCYDETPTDRYPVLYLLHGQTFTQDQWLRIGATNIADQLIHSREAMPFIIVLPDDHYWNAPAGSEFGSRLINNLIPYVDAKYRTRAERSYRALGGLSRGGGWTAELGFEHPELFGALGLHSPALFRDNAPYLYEIIKNIPAENRPQLWHDIGEDDSLLGDSLLLEDVLAQTNYVHVFHRFKGDHTERYWSKHTEQYLRWYVEIWRENSSGQ